MTDEIMMHGSTMLDLRKGRIVTSGEKGATSDELDAAVGRVREVYERAVAQVPANNAIDDDLYSCGWTIPYLRKLRPR